MADRPITSTPTIVRETSWEFQQTITTANQSQIDILIATLLPELYVIWQSLILYKINPQVIPPIIKALGDIVYSSKLGEVIIEIRPDPKTGSALIRRVRSIDTRHLDMEALDRNSDKGIDKNG